MSLTKSFHTYAQFTNLMFDSLSTIEDFSTQDTIINDHEEAVMTSFVNDHSKAEVIFEVLFDFLHEYYFSKAAFEFIYLNSKKTIAFIEELNMIDFTKESNDLRSSIKHKIKIMKWFILINKAELNEFLWFTSFLRQFISSRIDHVLIIKKIYMMQISIKSARMKFKIEVKKCDEDLIKRSKRKKIDIIVIIKRQWVKRSNDEFVWEQSQQTSFDHVKKSITENAMTTTTHELQYHLTANASKRVIEACLFQISEKAFDTIMTSQLKNKIKIVMFMSFRLKDVETRYSNIERKCLIIVNVLTKVRWLIVKNKWKIICYIDHHVLNSIMTKKSNEYDCIATWQDRLKKYDIKVVHKSTIDSMINIANELSRLSEKLIIKYRTKDQKRSSFMSEEDEDEVKKVTKNNEKKEKNESLKKQATKYANEIVTIITSKDWTRSTREKSLSDQRETKKWEKYDWHSLFKSMIIYLRFDLSRIEEFSRQKRKMIINQSSKYSLIIEKSLLMYQEKNDRRSSCLTKNQIDFILEHLHDEHDHYDHVITLNRMKSEIYWSIKTQNVIAWCKSCTTYQLNVNKHLIAVIKHVLTFELMSMINLNFLNSIKSAYIATECRYILLKVDYFNRFVWARSYVYCSMTKSADLMNNLIAFIFEWFKAIYSNNDTHFIEFEFEKLLKTREVIHFIASINHSFSVNLIERMIQLMIEDIKKRCIQRRNSRAWALDVIDETITINIRRIRIHEHRSCDIMLEFVSKIMRHDIVSMKSSIWEDEMKNLSKHAQNLTMILRAENRILILKVMTKYQDEKENKQMKRKSNLKKRDLILIRDKVRDNQ